jgi:peptide/nickel transport system ATP-binding protein
VLMNPRHPYTIGMLSSTITAERRGKDIEAIVGSPPDMRALPSGCSFAARCRFAIAACTTTEPAPVLVGAGHSARCIRLGDSLPS